MKDTTGVYKSKNGIIDLTYLNTKAEWERIENATRNCAVPNIDAEYYARPTGTIIVKYTYTEIVDWFADMGAICKTYTETKVLGYHCEKIKDKGKEYRKYRQFCKVMKNMGRK